MAVRSITLWSAPAPEAERLLRGLAEAGRSVLLLEAGGDPRQLSGTNDDQPGINRLPDDYDVPSFHGFASENDAMRWDFFVRHYASDEMQQKDPKYRKDYRGVPGGRSALSARRNLRRLHGAQRDDPGLSAQCGLGRDRPADR